jgi:hypothetical protein
LEVLAENFTVLKQFKESKYSSFIEKEPYVARVRFTSEQNIKADRGISISHLEGLVYEMHFFDIEEFINLLICNGCLDKVLSPKWLNQKMIERCNDIIGRLVD